MAKGLPQYQRSLIQAPGMQDFQLASLQEEVRSSQATSAALDRLSQYAFAGASRYAEEQAAKYAVDNPLTLEELEIAKETGVNPITEHLKGGTVWNDAVRKLYAQQASIELTNAAQLKVQDVYDRVLNNEINDTGVIKTELETPIRSYAKVLAEIDPVAANQYLANNISSARTYFRKSTEHLKLQDQLKLDANTELLLKNQMIEFEALSSTDVSVEEYLAKYEIAKANAYKALEFSQNKAGFEKYVDSRLQASLFDFMSDRMRSQYKNAQDLYNALEKNKVGEFKPIWDKLDKVEREALSSKILNDFNTELKQKVSNLKAFDGLVKNITDKQLSMDKIDEKDIQVLQEAITSLGAEGTEEGNAALLKVIIQQNIANQLNKLDDVGVSQFITKMKQDNADPGIIEFAEKYADKRAKAVASDHAGVVLKQNEIIQPSTNVLLSNNSDDVVIAFKEQMKVLDREGVDGVFTQAQVNQLKNTLSQASNDQKITIASNIVALGPKALDVFNQINEKDPVFAHVGLLMSDYMNAGEGMSQDTQAQLMIAGRQLAADILQGQANLQAFKITLPENRKVYQDNDVKINQAFEYSPEIKSRIFSVADALYASMVVKENVSDVGQYAFNNKTYEKALDMAVGKIGDKGGFLKYKDRYILIPNTVRGKDIDNVMETSDMLDFVTASINPNVKEKNIIADMNGLEIPLSKLRNAQLINLGEYYGLVYQGQVITDGAGDFLRIDLESLNDSYQNRERLGPMQQRNWIEF